MKKEFAFAICAAMLMGASQITKHDYAEVSIPAREAHVSPKSASFSAGAELAKPDPSTQLRVLKNYGNLPLAFEKNQGQTDSRVKFLSRNAGYTLFLTADEAVLSLPTNKANDEWPTAGGGNEGQQSLVGRQLPNNEPKQQMRNPILRLKLVGGARHATVRGVDELPGKSNYLVGNDPKKWRSNVPTYAKVKYEEIYSGIDLVYYGNQQNLEYDFIVAPGADPRRIAFNISGTKRIRRDERGDLVLKMRMGENEIRWHKPVAYQEENGTRQLVAVDYAVKDKNRVGFELGGYDASRPLYIDPLIYSTYLGGSGNDSVSAIAVDSSGNVYVAGGTSSSNFPTMNPLQPTIGGLYDNAFVAKLNASGSALVYSTYLGGSGNDGANAIAVDSSGNVYVAGGTNSSNFPTMNPLQPTIGGGYDAFVAKLNASGSALVYSTYLGGGGNDGPEGIAVDSSGNAYVTGSTDSTNFPTMNPLQPTFGGPLGGVVGADAFVTKLNASGSALVYSTYLGGSGNDGANAIAVDSSGNAYVTGSTSSTDFPTMNPLQPANGGNGDAFVTKLNASGSALVYSTYLGGSLDDLGHDIAVDSSGNTYLMGMTSSTNFPVMNPLQPTLGGSYDAFVAKLNASGSALVYSTYLGGSGVENGNAIAVDSLGNAYVAGETNSTNFPTMDPLQPTLGGFYNAFVAKLNASGSALVYSTYFGGSGYDSANRIAVDSSGNAYIAGFTTSTNFPTMNPLQPANAGGAHDAFVAKFAATSTGTDFSLSAAIGNNCPTGGNCSTSATVTAGQGTTYNLQISPANGFSGTVGLSCSDALAESTCSLSPGSVTISGAASSGFTVSVSTSASSTMGPQTKPPNIRPSTRIVFSLLAALMVTLLLVTSAVEAKQSKRRLVPALAVLVLSLAWLSSCGGGGGGNSGGGGGGNNGTPSGTVTINGTSNGVNHSLSLTLNVNQ